VAGKDVPALPKGAQFPQITDEPEGGPIII
jgi:hypothetical protein